MIKAPAMTDLLVEQELVAPMLMLAGDGGAFVTGTTVVVDGGWLAK